MNNRRNFIKTAALGVVGASLIPEIVSAAMPESSKAAGKIKIPDNATILFQGDSITDAHRDRKQTSENNAMGLGTGYALGAASTLLLNNPSKNLKIYNRGISGNKVYQLADRWEEDCLAIKPDILSILVGVNDYWHTLSGKYKGTIKTYRDDFKALLDKTKNRLPDVKLIIGEPYTVNGVKAVTDAWFPAFYDYQHAARELAESFDAVFIPYQKVYDTAQKMAPGSYWTPDGVHPSVAGARLMAEAWLKAVKG